ncbi:malic enzyme, putative [Babesia ovata]|uniref:Malic enzyme, putative n=1 Tax=Babesia ovata TaxID=189622 RepID=A0A2H6K726_9APIC|nr:malic enzyme, putative [Babesia ovata]GBE58768.1 malic enzyme, putative [Babesia ovata]
MENRESYEDLQAKIADYREKIQLVQEALQQDPDNEELKVLQADLREVIQLTEDLIQYKRQNEAAASTTDGGAKAPEPEEATSATGGNAQFLGTSAAATTQGSCHAGRICVVLYNGKQKFGQIIQLMGDLPTDQVVIQLVGSGEQCALAAKDLKLVDAPSPDLCKPGTLVQVLYSEDGRWYDALINRETETGYVITYKDYNISEEVARDWVRLKIRHDAKSKEVKEIVTPAGYRIPENLIIKQNDNEKEKMRKKKLVQTLKKQQKAERIETEANQRANSWRKFQEKAGSKNKSGYMTGKREGSIFSSTDQDTSLSAPNILYNSFVPRKKFDFNERF